MPKRAALIITCYRVKKNLVAREQVRALFNRSKFGNRARSHFDGNNISDCFLITQRREVAKTPGRLNKRDCKALLKRKEKIQNALRPGGFALLREK
jgi:hypothetical protein